MDKTFKSFNSSTKIDMNALVDNEFEDVGLFGCQNAFPAIRYSLSSNKVYIRLKTC